MNHRHRHVGLALLVLFVLSGFAGLIYQSIWSHYLGLTLGHAAYAQTLVLAIFMGGMALGAWLAGRWTLRMQHLILGYAVIEGAIGLFGLVFHPLFVAYTDVSQNTVLPGMTSATAASLYQWLTATLIILPQCILLGATFPLLSAGYLRLSPADDGRVLGGLYFSNSVGAGIGALVTTFVLLPWIGMPGSMTTAGVLNLVVAAGSFLVWKVYGSGPAVIPRPESEDVAQDATTDRQGLLQIMLVSTFLSGAFSFVYEIGWIRMLNQALGTTIHSFELMLAAFIFGLAFGGLWVRQRSARIADAVRYAGYAQILMGIAALASVIVFTQSFAWVGWMMANIERTDEGYTLFSTGSALISLLVMFPAAFFAGMTLPLFTMALLRRGVGEESIGRIYAANTLGAIVGVMLAVHVLIPLIGVRMAVIFAAVGDAAIGLYLLRRVSPARATRGYALAGASVAIVLVLSMLLGRTDPHTQVAGVFRNGGISLDASFDVAFLRDGKTATIAVYADGDGRYGTISTNGKPDASLSVLLNDPPRPDEITMLMAAALPLALHPAPKDVAIIGWGSGLTTHTMLGSPVPQKVESIEIERAMWDGAKLFGSRVARGYEDPRATTVFEDARTWFATGGRHYDVIISEPSNPWVSGVASLFTDEFYAFLRKHLNERGLLIQWIQSYEISDPLMAQMVQALLNVFPHVQLYTTNESDLLFVASAEPIGALDYSRLDSPELRRELPRVGLNSAADLQFRQLATADIVRTYTRLMGAMGHSDFYPTVSLQAPRDRFARRQASLLQSLSWSGLPIVDTLTGVERLPASIEVLPAPIVADSRGRALLTVEALRTGVISDTLPKELTPDLELLITLSKAPVAESDAERWSEALSTAVSMSLGQLVAEDLEGIWIAPTWLASGQPAFVEQSMALVAAAARRDRAAMYTGAESVLELDTALSATFREQALILGMTGKAADKDFAAVRSLEDRFGQGQHITEHHLGVRAFLLAWSDPEA